MNGTYRLTYRVWPFQTDVSEQAFYRKACGDEIQVNHFQASDFEDAYRQAKTYLAGVKTNKCVWQCPIQSLELMK